MKDYTYTDISVVGFLDGDTPSRLNGVHTDMAVYLRDASAVHASATSWPEQGTNKVVTISAKYTGITVNESLSLHLSPVMVAILVRRLIDILDRCQREDPELALPNLHSNFLYRVASAAFEGDTLGYEDLDRYLDLQNRWRNTNRALSRDEETVCFTQGIVNRVLKRGPTHPTSGNDNS